MDTLALSGTLDKKQEHFLRLCCDPQRERASLVTIARDAGLRPIDVLDLFRTASFAKAHAFAMGQLAESLPAVVRDLAEKAVDAKIECPRCFGERYEREGIECVMCLGKGTIFRPSDLDRQKVVMTATGVLKQGQGVSVQVNQQTNVSSNGGSGLFSKYVKASDEAAYDVSDLVVEAEKVDDGS